MAQPTKPSVVYHADWSSKEARRWCTKAVLGNDGRYTAFAPERVSNPGSLVGQFRKEERTIRHVEGWILRRHLPLRLKLHCIAIPGLQVPMDNALLVNSSKEC